MKKKLYLAGVIIVSALFMSGCGVDVTTGNAYNVRTYVDYETGVNYIYVVTSTGVAITPRLNADGSVYVK